MHALFSHKQFVSLEQRVQRIEPLYAAGQYDQARLCHAPNASHVFTRRKDIQNIRERSEEIGHLTLLAWTAKVAQMRVSASVARFCIPGADVRSLNLFFRAGSSRVERQPVRRWLVLQQGPNPSTDYYVNPRLAATGLPITYKHLDHDRPRHDDLDAGTGVVIVRYLNAAWVKALYRYKDRLAPIIYFMDDDLWRPELWKRLPRSYAKKLNTHCRAFIGDIHRLSTEFWFSGTALLDRYPVANGRVVMPCALETDTVRAAPYTPPPKNAPITIFYHGTSVHQDEIRWLRPVVARILERCPAAHFEIVGNHEVNVQYRDLPRTRILHPMSWPNYLSHCRAMDGHIGLAPLLAGSFNASRSYIKAFDIARCGAAGVYSAYGPYKNVVTHERNGLLLDNDPDLWVDAVCELIERPERLTALREEARGFHALKHEPGTRERPIGGRSAAGRSLSA
jgi:glycosyltransferase involved in cell wall biosynthesis